MYFSNRDSLCKYRIEDMVIWKMWQHTEENFVEIFSKVLKYKKTYLVLLIYETLPNNTFHYAFFRDWVFSVGF